MIAVANSLVCLAVFTTSAAAECAWVVWEWTTTSSGDDWKPVPSHKAEADCQSYAQQMTKAKGMGRERPDAYLFKSFLDYVCLPDTVDPRGPKVK
jgi:hypothetical protein